MLDQVLAAFAIVPDYDLDIMQPGQTLLQSTSRILGALENVFDAAQPDLVIVQGDTTTTFCGALAGFYRRVDVAHVEAGLRTGDLQRPFPEELNRVVTARVTRFHFAATQGAAENLYRENVNPADVIVTGNTGIDALLHVKNGLEMGILESSTRIAKDSRKLIVVTAHRRESFGKGLEKICCALARIAQRDDVEIVFPVHPNPRVRETVRKLIGSIPNIALVEPMGYVQFVDLMTQAYILLTDSGGVQEEGPSLGKPILVLREKTERPEAIHAGTVKLVGTDADRIVREVSLLLDSPSEYKKKSRQHNPYGDGHACERIESALRSAIVKELAEMQHSRM